MKGFSVKAKLYLIICIMLIPMIMAQAYSIYYQFNKVIDYQLEAHDDFAEAISMTFTNHIQSIDQELVKIGMSLYLMSNTMELADVNSYLKRESDFNHTIVSHSLIGTDGVVIASALDDAIGVSIRDREYYKRIISGEDFVVSEPLMSKVSKVHGISVARAIRDEEQLIGMMLAVIEVDQLKSIFPEQRVAHTASFGLADSTGTIVVHNKIPGIIKDMRKISSESTKKTMELGKPLQDRKFKGTWSDKYYIGVSVPISELGWVVFANNEYNETWKNAIVSISQPLLILVVSTMIALFVAVRLCQRILVPLDSLQKFANEVAAGNLNVRTNIIGNNELATTGQALDKMATRIEHLENTRRQFLQTAAHELRNPMTGIKGSVALIKRRIKSGKSVDNVEKMLDIAEKEVDRLSAILNQIISAFKADNSNAVEVTYNFEAVNLVDFAEKVTAIYQSGIDNINIMLNANGYESIIVKGNAARLEEVMRNLLSNAVKYSHRDRNIKVSLQADDTHAVISVKDKGIGIPQDMLDSIFESFVRAENYEGNDPGGMGLGLYISRDIISKHGGTIWAESNPDQGSIFYIKLPLLKREI